jgi:hypothetical protein
LYSIRTRNIIFRITLDSTLHTHTHTRKVFHKPHFIVEQQKSFANPASDNLLKIVAIALRSHFHLLNFIYNAALKCFLNRDSRSTSAESFLLARNHFRKLNSRIFMCDEEAWAVEATMKTENYYLRCFRPRCRVRSQSGLLAN